MYPQESNTRSLQLRSRILCIFRSRTFVPISWMYKKETSVSHSSTESEVVSLDAGLRMDGIPALDFWDVIIELLHPKHEATCCAMNIVKNIPNVRTKGTVLTRRQMLAGHMLIK